MRRRSFFSPCIRKTRPMKILIFAGAATVLALGLVLASPPPLPASASQTAALHDELRWTERNAPYVVAKVGAPITLASR